MQQMPQKKAAMQYRDWACWPPELGENLVWLFEETQCVALPKRAPDVRAPGLGLWVGLKIKIKF